MQSPPAEPLKQENMEAFRAVLAQYERQMAGDSAEELVREMMEVL